MSSTPPPAGLAPIEALATTECHALVARNRLCVLSVVDGTHPYAVPLFYGFDGRTVHLGLSEGRKVAALEANPRVCLTVIETGPGDAWASVQVTGIAEWVPGGAEREASLEVLTAHNRRIRERAQPAPDAYGLRTSGPPAPAGAHVVAPRHGTGRVLRVGAPKFSGRARR